jgi:hypothetical protein
MYTEKTNGGIHATRNDFILSGSQPELALKPENCALGVLGAFRAIQPMISPDRGGWQVSHANRYETEFDVAR